MKRAITIPKWGWKEFDNQFKAELLGGNCLGKVKKGAMWVLRQAQDEFVKNLPANEEYIMPFETGNLHDSIVSVLSYNGRVLAAAYTDPVATEASIFTGKDVYKPTHGGGRKRIIGAMEAYKSAKKMWGKYYGFSASLIVSVPYAENPNELSDYNKKGTHVGYLDALGARYAKTMDRGFLLYDNYEVFNWKGYSIPVGGFVRK